MQQFLVSCHNDRRRQGSSFSLSEVKLQCARAKWLGPEPYNNKQELHCIQTTIAAKHVSTKFTIRAVNLNRCKNHFRADKLNRCKIKKPCRQTQSLQNSQFVPSNSIAAIEHQFTGSVNFSPTFKQNSSPSHEQLSYALPRNTCRHVKPIFTKKSLQRQ